MGEAELDNPAGGRVFARLAQFDDYSLYGVLVREALGALPVEEGERALILVDAASARAAADSMIPGHASVVFGIEGAEADSPASPPATTLFGHERFLVVLTPKVSIAILATAPASTPAPGPCGGWTLARPDVMRVAEALLASPGVPEGLRVPETAPDSTDEASAFAMRMVQRHSESASAAAAGADVNRDDLFSVLDILKAISAKRRAHDILFVFVEQIAKILHVDRCSIVRVWGGDRKGHVLASHEDERINDLVISLDKYPELRTAMETRDRVVIADAARDPLTREFSEELKRADILSLVVIPIVLFDPNVGSLFLRAARHRATFSAREVNFCEIVAEAASNALERAQLFEQIQRTNERLEFLAVTDGLTGLYNHRYFRKRLQEEFDRAVRYGLSLSCLIFDVDNFKRINDTHGHLQGDSVLREMALRIIRTVRKSDIVARYGGEEFTVILPQTALEGAISEAKRLHQELSERPYQGMPEGQPVTVSIGVSALEHEAMLDSDALLRVADNALYNAKRQGKNRVVVGPVEGDQT